MLRAKGQRLLGRLASIAVLSVLLGALRATWHSLAWCAPANSQAEANSARAGGLPGRQGSPDASRHSELPPAKQDSALGRRVALSAALGAVSLLDAAPANAVYGVWAKKRLLVPTDVNEYKKPTQPSLLDTLPEEVLKGPAKADMTKEEIIKAAEPMTDFQRSVVFQAVTERSYRGKTVNGYSWNEKSEGTYVSAISGMPVFTSHAKYDSGTGWASFWAPVDHNNIVERIDPDDIAANKPESEWRMEILDRASLTHLGHVFGDGPFPTRKRYCINAAALKFEPGPSDPGDARQAGPQFRGGVPIDYGGEPAEGCATVTASR